MKAFEIGAKKTVVFYLHGLRGHGYSQKSALEHMVKNVGVSMVSLELPGHGAESVKAHCMVPAFREIVNMIVAEVQQRAGEAEQVILMGYSFGGALMTLAADQLERDTNFSPLVGGYIGISSAYDVGHNVPRWQLMLAGLIAPISRFLYYRIPRWSRFVTIREMDVELISADLQVQESIRRDNLVYKGRIPLNTSAQVYKASVAAKALVNALRCPILLLHSRDDVISIAPTADTFDAKIQLRLFKNLRHNCIDGLSREAVVARKLITQFIAEKL